MRQVTRHSLNIPLPYAVTHQLYIHHHHPSHSTPTHSQIHRIKGTFVEEHLKVKLLMVSPWRGDAVHLSACSEAREVRIARALADWSTTQRFVGRLKCYYFSCKLFWAFWALQAMVCEYEVPIRLQSSTFMAL